jgi:hypothetical protein
MFQCSHFHRLTYFYLLTTFFDATTSPLLDSQEPNYVTKRKFGDLKVRSQHSALKGVEGRAKVPG